MAKHWFELVVAVLFIMLAGGVDTACDVRTEYQCKNGNCIPLSSFNNSVNDCGDNSDEVPNPCRTPLYSCKNDRCVMMHEVNDGKDDCLDQSDEVKRIGDRCVVDASCCFCHEYVTHSECVDGVCRCQDGYRMNDLGTVCLPIKLNGISLDAGDNTSERNDTAGGRRPSKDSAAEKTDFAAEVAVVTVVVVVICLLTFVDAFLLVWLFKAFVFTRSPPSDCRQLFAVMGL